MNNIIYELFNKMEKSDIWVYKIEDGGLGLVQAETSEEAEVKVREAYNKRGGLSENTEIYIFDIYNASSLCFKDSPDVVEIYEY